MIKTVRVKGKLKYRVVSHTSGRNFGTYPHTASGLKKAKERLRQVKFFGSR